MLFLACDGPLNGQYIDPETADLHGYDLTEWPTGEYVWMLRGIELQLQTTVECTCRSRYGPDQDGTFPALALCPHAKDCSR